MAQHINIHEITGSITDIHQNLNTLFADNYIIENDIKDFRKIFVGINSNISGVQSNIGTIIKTTEKLCIIFKELKDEIHIVKKNQKEVYNKVFLTTFSYGLGIFSSLAVVTMVMRQINN